MKGLAAADPPPLTRVSALPRGFSVYLDLLRVLAALTVFATHDLNQFNGCYGNAACGFVPILLPFHAGHIAVIVFFVLSGYVITYVAAERERTVVDFAVSRLARIYSVALPAMVLVMGIDVLLVSAGKTGTVPVYQLRELWKYLPLFVTFTTDFWSIGQQTFSDLPFWSLGYEVWYYVVFAVFFYATGRTRWICALSIFLLVGPKLWALFPIWGIGNLLYRLHRRGFPTMGVATARIVMAVTIAVLLAAIELNLTDPVDRWVDGLSGGWIVLHLRASQWFLSDTLLVPVIAANLFAARYARLGFGRLIAPIRVLASFSFTLYLMHWPLLEFWRFYLGLDAVAATFAVLCCVGLLGLLTEHQKDRLRHWLYTLFGRRALPAGV
jgi:peptidoglycan/LPS O-acetylase OafA/YrhL